MNRQDIIQNELKELGLSQLASMSKSMPFAVPKHYFNELSENLNLLIADKDLVEPVFGFTKKMPFSGVPEAYFEGLSQQILAKVKTEQVVDWPKENPYFVPQGYFENLPNTILAAVKSSEKRKNVTPKRIPLYRTVQLAASMALIFFVGLGVFRMNDQRNSTDLFGQISQAEIAEYVNSNIDDFDTDLVLNGLAFDKVIPEQNNITDALSNDEIKDYLNEEGLD